MPCDDSRTTPGTIELAQPKDALTEFVFALRDNFEHPRELLAAAAAGGDLATPAARDQRSARIEEVMQGLKRAREEKSATSRRLSQASRRLSQASSRLSRASRSSTELEAATADIEEALASIEEPLANIEEASASIEEAATDIEDMFTSTPDTTAKQS